MINDLRNQDISIDQKKLREEYSNSVSQQALTDIIVSVDFEIKGLIREKGWSQVKDDFQSIIDKVNSEKMEFFLKGSAAFIFSTMLVITLAKDLIKENPMLAFIFYSLIAMPAMVFGNALAFEQSINKVTKNLSEDIKDNYTLTLKYLQYAWKPRTQNTNQDSSIMQKKLVLSQMQAYIETITLKEKTQLQTNLRRVPT